MKKTVKRLTCLALLTALFLSLCACNTGDNEDIDVSDTEEKESLGILYYGDDIYVPEEEKKSWYDAIVKLISNQEMPYGTPADGIIGYEPPRPDEPSIEYGHYLGLFDVNGDGVPELFLDLGGGSAGNSFYSVYDIFSGDRLGYVDGSGSYDWSIYYDIENDRYIPVGRFDWRSGDAGSLHYIKTLEYSEENKEVSERSLFSWGFSYDKIMEEDENGVMGIELEIAEADFYADGKDEYFQNFHYEMTDFYSSHSLVPHTGIKLYMWSDVSEEEDSDQVRAEKMANALLYESGQRFVRAK